MNTPMTISHMKTPSRSLSVLAAAVVALLVASRAHAQIETFNTIVANDQSTNINFTSGSAVALSQTFSDVAELNNVTYEFIENGTDSVSQTINAYLVQWNPVNNSVMSTITLETTPNSTANESTTSITDTPLQSFVVPPATGGAWTTQIASDGTTTYPAFQETLNINQILDPSLTYAIVLIDSSGANGSLGLPGVFTSGNSFDNSGHPYGTAYRSLGHSYPDVLSMVNSTGNFALSGAPDVSYGFSQIQLVPGNNTVPTPEPRTAAVILCALFVAGLVGRQLLLRRKESQVGEMPLAA
jgi:hypothetical protein